MVWSDVRICVFSEGVVLDSRFDIGCLESHSTTTHRLSNQIQPWVSCFSRAIGWYWISQSFGQAHINCKCSYNGPPESLSSWRSQVQSNVRIPYTFSCSGYMGLYWAWPGESSLPSLPDENPIYLKNPGDLFFSPGDINEVWKEINKDWWEGLQREVWFVPFQSCWENHIPWVSSFIHEGSSHFDRRKVFFLYSDPRLPTLVPYIQSRIYIYTDTCASPISGSPRYEQSHCDCYDLP